MRWTAAARRVTIAVALVITAAGLFPGPAKSAASVTYLGRMTNAVDPYPWEPLGAFRRRANLDKISPGATVLFVGVQRSGGPAQIARWPLIKALGQFGTFTGVSPLPDLFDRPPTRPFPDFDMRHAVFRSRYVSFVDRDLLDESGQPLDRLSAPQRELFNRYSNPLGKRATLQAAAWAASNAASNGAKKALPLIVIGRYVATASYPALTGDFFVYLGSPPTPCPAANCPQQGQSWVYSPFSDVRASLVAGRAVNGLPHSLVPDVNASANIMTALICRADKARPNSVCRRAVIRKLLKHVK